MTDALRNTLSNRKNFIREVGNKFFSPADFAPPTESIYPLDLDALVE
jgi:hypothetical protein